MQYVRAPIPICILVVIILTVGGTVESVSLSSCFHRDEKRLFRELLENCTLFSFSTGRIQNDNYVKKVK
jgi:hypothetical protein